MILANRFSTWLRATALLWVVVPLAACGPKRVVNTQPPPARPEPTVRKTLWPQDDEVDLPAEDSPATTPTVQDPPDAEPPIYEAEDELDALRLGTRAATLARDQVGKPYAWGGSGPDRFDCSGLVQYVYGYLGFDLPRVSHQQVQAGRHVPRKQIEPGDLLFFALDGPSVDHVAIYLGRQEFVHAPRRHNPVRIDSLNNSWWSRRLKETRRLF